MDAAIAERLATAGVELLPQPAPRHPYELATRAGDILYFSGKTPMRDGKIVHAGILRSESDVDRGRQAARLCTMQLLSAVESFAGLERVERMLKVTVFVASDPGFTAQPEVANAVSELLREVLGDAGSHARSAVGVAVLPGNSTVEVDAVVQVSGVGRA
ncbi:MAG: RidA family protein [Microbacterium sp.]